MKFYFQEQVVGGIVCPTLFKSHLTDLPRDRVQPCLLAKPPVPYTFCHNTNPDCNDSTVVMIKWDGGHTIISHLTWVAARASSLVSQASALPLQSIPTEQTQFVKR